MPKEKKMSDDARERALLRVEGGISWKVRNRSCQLFAPSDDYMASGAADFARGEHNAKEPKHRDAAKQNDQSRRRLAISEQRECG